MLNKEQRKCPIIDGLRYEGGPLMEAAANEIERLRVDNAELRKRLEEVEAKYKRALKDLVKCSTGK